MLTEKQTNLKENMPSNGTTLPILLITWLLCLSFMVGPFLDIVNYYVNKGLILDDKGKLILAGFILVLIYTHAEFFIYLTVFSIAQRVLYHYGKWASIWTILFLIGISFTFLIITTDYTGRLASPIILTIMYTILFFRMNIYEVKFRYQAIFLFQLTLAIQWFEISPTMRLVGFGKTISGQSIIDAAFQLQGDHILQYISILISMPFIFSVAVTAILFHINVLRMKELALSQQREVELQEMKIDVMESRASQEMHSLVHDLKTPLTTIQGLISLMQMQLKNKDSTAKANEYTSRIEQSIQHLNAMISEILYEDAKRTITIKALINYTRANLVEEKLKQEVNFTVENGDETIVINRVRIVRVLINLIQNAAEATAHKDDGVINIHISITKAYTHGEKREGALITVNDNGDGISEENMMRVWDVRYSTKGSSGLGLAFVKKVVNSHDGWIKIDSKQNEGTTFTMFLPKGSD